VATSPIGLDEWATSNLKAYPNPSSDWMQLESSGAGTWTIANVLGQQVASYESEGSLRISTTSLAEGTYVARFSGAQGAGTIIFIVQR
jgi:hypothetical protein